MKENVMIYCPVCHALARPIDNKLDPTARFYECDGCVLTFAIWGLDL